MHSSIHIVASSAVLLASQALAGMMGAQISATEIYGTAITGSLPTGVTEPSLSFTVTDGVEYQYRLPPPNSSSGFDIDISDTAIRINFHAPGTPGGWTNSGSPNFFDGYVIRDVNHQIPAFSGISIGAKSPGVPYTGGSVSFGPPWKGQVYVVDADTLVLNLAGLAGPDNTFIEFNVATVPTPGAAILLGVAGVFVRRRR